MPVFSSLDSFRSFTAHALDRVGWSLPHAEPLLRTLKRPASHSSANALPRDLYAIIVGINYYRSPQGWGHLEMSHENVQQFQGYLRNTFPQSIKDVIVMIDAQDTPHDLQPTHDNLIHQLHRFTDGRHAADYFFFYCGHGTQTPCKDGSERDGLEEHIVPSDATDKDRLIQDNVLRRYLVDRLPRGSNLYAIIDACHSGTMLDLLHDKCHRIYRLRSTSYRQFARKFAHVLVFPGRPETLDSMVSSMETTVDRKQTCRGLCRLSSTDRKKRVICISSCKDQESVYETSRTMSMNLLAFLADPIHRNPTLYDLMYELSLRAEEAEMELMKGRHGQRFRMSPQLSSISSLSMKKTKLYPSGSVFDTAEI